jgi:hypothetical protein
VLTSGVTNDLRAVYFTDANTGIAVGTSGRIIRTTNSGLNWNIITSGTGSVLYSVNFVNGNTGYISGTGVILNTTNGGVNWQNQPINVTSDLYSIYFSDNLNGMTVGQNGIILKTVSGGIGINQISTEVPDKFTLYQNYPNPFNPKTIIKFDIHNSGNVKLSIYDVSGKLIDELINQRLTSGTYTFDWNAEGFSSGIYFCTLETEKYNSSVKMLLVK